jgi:signal transduction histidine kinase
MRESESPSLVSYFKKVSIMWAFVGLMATLSISLAGLFILSKESAETKIETLAASATRAFRPMILDKNIRDAQFQIARVLDLKEAEHVIIRDTKFEAIYAGDSVPVAATCKYSNKVCWGDGFNSVTYLQPVYFNDDLKDSLFGYVEIKVLNHFNLALAGAFALALLGIFGVGAFLLFNSQKKSAKRIAEAVDAWASHLQKNPSFASEVLAAPYRELSALEASISSLHLEIGRLTSSASEAAKIKAQAEMLRDINHDLKTPVSQMAKFFEVHLAKTRRTGIVDEDLVVYMSRSLTRIGNLIRQVSTGTPREVTNDHEENVSDLGAEAKSLIEDFLQAETSLLQSRNISVTAESDIFVKIPQSQLYRIIDNLLRNAADAIDLFSGRILVNAETVMGVPTLTVADNGRGIPAANIDLIFNSGFSTNQEYGRGLGLSIVEKICNEHQAKVTVESNPGQGTVFTVQFLAASLPDSQTTTPQMEASL